MLAFMDYIPNAFFAETNWNRDNSYGSLTDTARALLDFPIPHGLRLNISSLSSTNFATSYTLGSTGLVDGSLSYLYTSRPLFNTISKSSLIPLNQVIPGYRQLQELRPPDESWQWEIWQGGKRIDRKDALLYGRLYLPTSTLEGLYLRRLTPLTHFRLTCVSSSRLPNGGSMLALLHHATPRHSTEYMYSTDSALLGIRSLYNFGPLPLPQTPSPHGRFSAGFELYYGLLNKSSGTSLGLRFATLPAHTGFPYTMTLTLNPLMGNLSSTYSVRASERLALSSRFDFNVYSYESELRVGLELWRRRRRQQRELSKPLMSDAEASKGESLQRREGGLHSKAAAAITTPTDKGIKSEGSGSSNNNDDDTAGVLKARIDQRGNIGVVWEGRVKELLYACGVVVGRGKGIGSGRGEGDWTGGGGGLVSGLGLEISYSS